jgi:hypothetical protein
MSSPAQTEIMGSNPTRSMDIRFSSVFVLSCVGSGLATGLIVLPRVLPTVYKIHTSRLILKRNRPQSQMRNLEEEEDEDKEKEGSLKLNILL